ncbi:hypothetical protein Vadar_030144 [Vaccinium darrowii]|uniref:Uncharacterized protein n=1 Tax=Vaccinium darrowii TaxID=229202 RepID=A0ACB7XV93_9ERIC|nr:hypothetical protein Vadar_030144 [Vaccinium darrowii]
MLERSTPVVTVDFESVLFGYFRPCKPNASTESLFGLTGLPQNDHNNFNVSTGVTELSAGAIVGIVAASFVLLVLILVVLRMKGCLGGKDLEDKELVMSMVHVAQPPEDRFKNLNILLYSGLYDCTFLTSSIFSLLQNFIEQLSCKQGVLSDGAVIAVKQLSSKSKQGNREFVNEIGMIAALQHPNLVKLYGCCIEGNQLLLIYEYMINNSLARALFAKLDEEENTHISTRIAGTIGYMTPEYALRGYLTDKADVYSFGIVALEIVSGKSNTSYRPKQEFVYLLDWAYVLQEQGNLLDLVDPSLGSNYSKEEALNMLNISLLCTNPSPTLRPSMSSAVSMLEGKLPIQATLIKRTTVNEEMRFKAFERLSQDSQTQGSSTISKESRVQRSISMFAPSSIDTSVSIPSKNDDSDHSSSSNLLQDLYDVNME